MATIAFLGIGLMGAEMAGRLREAKHDVRVWNRTHEKAERWARAGGHAFTTAAEAAEGASQIHIMVADDAAVEAALFGDRGALKTFGTGNLVVDHSTVSVAGVKSRHERLIRGGWRFLQAPVLAGPSAVAKGEGLMLSGGRRDIFNAVEPLLKQIIERQWWVGEKPEDAAAFKLMANSMLVSIVEALAEYFAIAKASGISAERAFELFQQFDPGSTIKIRGPLMARGEYAGWFSHVMARKDVGLMLEAAGGAEHVPALKVAADKLSRNIERGLGHLDLAALAADVIPAKSS